MGRRRHHRRLPYCNMVIQCNVSERFVYQNPPYPLPCSLGVQCHNVNPKQSQIRTKRLKSPQTRHQYTRAGNPCHNRHTAPPLGINFPVKAAEPHMYASRSLHKPVCFPTMARFLIRSRKAGKRSRTLCSSASKDVKLWEVSVQALFCMRTASAATNRAAARRMRCIIAIASGMKRWTESREGCDM